MPAAGGAYPGRRPFQNSTSQIVFEQLYLTGDRRLRNATALGGATEAAFLKDRQKQAQFFDHIGKGDLKAASVQSAMGIIWKPLTNATVRHMNGTNTYEQLLDRLNWRYTTKQFDPIRRAAPPTSNNRLIIPSAIFPVCSE